MILSKKNSLDSLWVPSRDARWNVWLWRGQSTSKCPPWMTDRLGSGTKGGLEIYPNSNPVGLTRINSQVWVNGGPAVTRVWAWRVCSHWSSSQRLWSCESPLTPIAWSLHSSVVNFFFFFWPIRCKMLPQFILPRSSLWILAELLGSMKNWKNLNRSLILRHLFSVL